MSDSSNQAGAPLYWQLVEPVWERISIYDGPATFVKQFHQAAPEVGHLFAAHWCQSEVLNGGFYQFFSNPTGVLAPEALEGFRAIGLEAWAETLEEAMRFFGSPYPREDELRHEKLARLRDRPREERDPFCALDARFYEWLELDVNRFDHAADKYAQRSLGY